MLEICTVPAYLITILGSTGNCLVLGLQANEDFTTYLLLLYRIPSVL